MKTRGTTNDNQRAANDNARIYLCFANSNRLSYAATGKTLAQSTYPTTNNRFSAVTGGAVNLTPSYDATGNIIYMYNVTYNYDARNRMASSVNAGITTNYWINGLGQRVRKTYNAATPSSLTFVYDEARRHIGTYNLAGAASEETIYLGDTPVAVLMGAEIYYVYADQTNTPRVITNTTGQPRWTWDSTAPFGQTLPNLNPAGLGNFVYRHGMPGQVYDAESGAYNNGFRDYYPLIGRYLQSDPIGLAGGDFSTYGYVGQSPVSYIDPLGLDRIKICLKQHTLTLTDDDGNTKMQSSSAHGGCEGSPSKTGKFKAGLWQKDKVSQGYPNTKIPYSDPWLGWASGYGPWFLPINTLSGQYTATGIHGTWFGGAMPWSCSHGCVRIPNSDVEQLHQMLPNPKGTPIEIEADCGGE